MSSVGFAYSWLYVGFVLPGYSSPVTNHGDIHPHRFLLLLCEKVNSIKRTPWIKWCTFHTIWLKDIPRIPTLARKQLGSLMLRCSGVKFLLFYGPRRWIILTTSTAFVLTEHLLADRAFVVIVLEVSCMAKVDPVVVQSRVSTIQVHYWMCGYYQMMYVSFSY